MNDYVRNYWKKVDTPFLDENKEMKTYTFLFEEDKYNSDQDIETSYFDGKDIQGTLISHYISKEERSLKRDEFFYQIFPCFVTSFLPNNSNYSVSMITPDLSKEYQEEEKTFRSMKIKRKTYNYLSTINCVTLEDDMLVIWIIMWRMCFKFITQEEEKAFRVDQLCGILYKHLKNNKTFKKALLLFEEVLNVILKHGTLSMVKQVLKLMKYLKIKRNSTIDNIFFMAIRKKREILSRMEEAKAGTSAVKICDMIKEIEDNTISNKNFKKWSRSLDSSRRETIIEKKSFLKRTFKCGKDLHNFMIKDIISMSADAYCGKCDQTSRWPNFKKCKQSNEYGLFCSDCQEPMISNLHVVIGCKQNLPIETYCSESQAFLKIQDLRRLINDLYEIRLVQTEEEIFSLMIFRELSRQLFWNCIFHMIDYKMPYDFILPYEGSDIFKELKNANRHIFISSKNKAEGFQIKVRKRRHKSDVPKVYW